MTVKIFSLSSPHQTFLVTPSHAPSEWYSVFLCFQLNKWPRSVSAKFHYTIYPITFSVGNADEWKKLFKPCAAQRLFLPVSLQHLSPLISPLCVISLTSLKRKWLKSVSFLLRQHFPGRNLIPLHGRSSLLVRLLIISHLFIGSYLTNKSSPETNFSKIINWRLCFSID